MGALLRPGGIVIMIEIAAMAASLAVPAWRDAAMKSQATQIAKDLNVVCAAALEAKARLSDWPEDAEAGRVPPALTPYLPTGFRFNRGGYRFDWDHWTASDGSDALGKSGDFVAVSVIVADARLASLVARRLETTRIHYSVGKRSTIMITDPIAPAPRSVQYGNPGGIS
jgi:hypothetical protein